MTPQVLGQKFPRDFSPWSPSAQPHPISLCTLPCTPARSHTLTTISAFQICRQPFSWQGRCPSTADPAGLGTCQPNAFPLQPPGKPHPPR